MSSKRKVPACPDGTPDDVRAEFDRFLQQMGKNAKPIDETALLMLAQSVATWKKATAAVNSLGLLVSSGGVTIPNPSISIAAKAQAQAATLMRELRLTPATRLDFE